ncbi:MAG: hypothetical protein Q8R29_03155 [bacterium]|nr:hypothetical protein [bacterium]
MELVFLRQLVQIMDEMDNIDMEIISVTLCEAGEDEEVIGIVENDDIKKLCFLREKLKEEILEKGSQDALVYLEDMNFALEVLTNLRQADVVEAERRVRAQVVRRNQYELRKLRYQIVEKVLAYAVLTKFPEVHDTETIFFRKGWKITKKPRQEETSLKQ